MSWFNYWLAVNNLTVPKLSYLGERSEGQPSAVIARVLNKNDVSWQTRNNRNSQSTKSAKTLKLFNVYSSLGLMKIMSQFFNDHEIQNPGS